MHLSFAAQIINLLAAVLLLLSFAMLTQRRILSLINLFALQGLTLTLSTLVVAWSTAQHHLYYSAALTFALKVLVLPWVLHRLIRKLSVKWDVETLINIPTTMLVGIVLVILAFNVALPALVAKLALGGFAMALIEMLSAKMRIFRAPEYLGTAFLLAVLAMLIHFLLET